MPLAVAWYGQLMNTPLLCIAVKLLGCIAVKGTRLWDDNLHFDFFLFELPDLQGAVGRLVVQLFPLVSHYQLQVECREVVNVMVMFPLLPFCLVGFLKWNVTQCSWYCYFFIPLWFGEYVAQLRSRYWYCTTLLFLQWITRTCSLPVQNSISLNRHSVLVYPRRYWEFLHNTFVCDQHPKPLHA